MFTGLIITFMKLMKGSSSNNFFPINLPSDVKVANFNITIVNNYLQKTNS